MRVPFAQHVRRRMIALAALIALVMAQAASAAEVKFTISAREAYVNQPITLQVEIENAQTYNAPEMPKITGAAVNPTPSKSESMMTQITNGRVVNTKTVVLSYRIVPFQPGAITIPPISVVADGQTFTSDAIEVIISDSETGDLLFAEILADRLNVYLGEPVTLRLRLWIKPFTDRPTQFRMQADHMWERIDRSATNWGDFRAALTPKSNNPFSNVHVAAQEVIREDEQGNRGAYYLYEIETTFWPTQTGPLQLEEPVIVVNYPLRLVRQDSFFSRGTYAIADARPISVTVQSPPVDVVAPPSEGQPDTFNGAVGNYSISTSARPTEVAVGDPITLVVTIHDHGDPGSAASRLNLLPPPPLDRVKALADDFRMPNDPLAGAVTGTTKVFTQTVRAKSDQVTHIPAIPLTVFDPVTETYITRTSNPIPITVRAGSQIGASDIIAAPSTTAGPARSGLTANSAGLLANFPAETALASAEPFRLSATAVALLAVPPLLFAGIAVLRTSSRFRQRNAAGLRRRTAGKRAAARLKDSRFSDARSQAHAALTAFSEYITDRLDVPSRALTSAEICDILRQRNTNAALLAEIEQVLIRCERIAYAGDSAVDQSPNDLARHAADCIKQLERVRLT